MRIIVAITCLSFVFNLSAEYEKYIFTHYSVDHGLSQSSVTCILQDRKGFMWFGTWDGLNRFDGYSFKAYKYNPHDPHSISHNGIYTICEDKDGILWIGTNGGGMNKFDPETEHFTHYRFSPDDSNTISHDVVKTIIEDKQGYLWIGTSGGGLCKFDKKTERFTRYRATDTRTRDGLSSNDIWTLYADSKGYIWIGNFIKGLNKLDPQTGVFYRYYHDPDDINNVSDPVNYKYTLADNVVRCIFEDKDGFIWVGCFHNGVSRFDPQAEVFVSFSHDPADPYSIGANRVEAAMQDKQGRLWFATFGGGLNYYDPMKNKFYRYINDKQDITSISADKNWCIYEDKTGIIWIGTSGGGVNSFNPNKKKFNVYQNIPGDAYSISNNAVQVFTKDKYNNIWVGTSDGLNLFCKEQKKFYAVKHNPSDPNTPIAPKIWSLSSGKSSHLWIGYDGIGLDMVYLDPLRFSAFQNNTQPLMLNVIHFTNEQNASGKQLFSSGYTRVLYEDSRGYLWMGVWEGGVRYFSVAELLSADVNKIQFIPVKLSDNTIFSIVEDSENNIWIGTRNGGVNKYDVKRDTIIVYKNNPQDTTSLSNNMIYYIYEDKNKNMWFATALGLNKFDKKTEKFTAYDMRHGFLSNIILSILEDNHNNLWLGTDYGLSKFNMQTKEVKNYTLNDGLPSNSFAPMAAIKGDDNIMYFGNTNGLVVFCPDSIRDNPFKPSVVLTGFQLFNKEVSVGTVLHGRQILPKALSFLDKLVLSYKDAVFSFEFSSLDYAAPARNLYAYKLEGFDKDWNYTRADRRFVTYTNLSPGNYVFRVKASNNDGVWNEEGLALKIRIVPPFWRTWWFIILFSVLVIISTYEFIRYRLYQIKRDRELLQAQIEQAIAEVEQQKEELMAKNDELIKKREQEQKHKWISEGLAMFADIQTRERSNSEKLLKTVIKNLVRYINAAAGSICVLNDMDEQDVYLEVVAGYALNNERVKKKKFLPNEGEIGACFQEKRTMYITDLPDNYFKVSSGLGEKSVNYLLLVPLMMDEIALGVIELASFTPFDDELIHFVEKVAASLASSLYVLNVTAKTTRMYEQSREQAERLAANEEELRQTIEEMQATQEEMSKKEKILIDQIQKLNEQLAAMKNKT